MNVSTVAPSKFSSFTGEVAEVGIEEATGMSNFTKGSIILGAATVVTTSIAGIIYWRRGKKEEVVQVEDAKVSKKK